MKKILFLLLLIITVSCRQTKTVTEYKEVIRVDTFKTTRTEKIFQAVHDTLTIENPCDSSGILSTFYSKIKIPQGQVVIRSVRGKIEATVDIDSIAHVYEDKYRNKSESKVSIDSVDTIRYMVPTWAIIVILIESAIIVLYAYFKFLVLK
jgi:hypothetical protein